MHNAVDKPIINSPYEEPRAFWYLREGHPPEKRDGRRPPLVYPPRDQREPWTPAPAILDKAGGDFPNAYELKLVSRIREQLARWRAAGRPGATRVTAELLAYWTRPEREYRLFFAQLEAAETVIFLHEARADFLQGLDVPRDDPSAGRADAGYAGFRRLACKVATGGGKTTVMAMVAAWSILNKVADPHNAAYADAVLVVCPNITIRNRLEELKPGNGDGSLYRTADLVPPHLMPRLAQGRVLVTNWHVLERKSSQEARVVRAGVRETRRETIHIGKENTTLRGKRYLTLETFRRQVTLGLVYAVKENIDDAGALKSALVENELYFESDGALVRRVVGRDLGDKKNILVFNDEAHHAYRVFPEEEDDQGSLLDEEREEEFFREATVWVDGLDRLHKVRGVNFCLDLSATPYFLGRVGRETNKPFPWVVSDFGLVEAIESGLTKIPQLVARDPSGAAVPYYFNIWEWVLEKLTPAERGGRARDPKPEAVLKYAIHPLEMLAGHWKQTYDEWQKTPQDPRPPVFIVVCKNTKIAKLVYEWIAEGDQPAKISPFTILELQNRDGAVNTIRVDSKVVSETDSGTAKDDETRWMRLTLDTVGKREWPLDRQGRPMYPEGFEDLATKLGRPNHPPGRDVRGIVSVGMLTEGWDCKTVTHIVGLRPFMSQLLCEQVVGRGLRRRNYDLHKDKDFLDEEVSKVLGVPFEIIPYKAAEGGAPPPPVKRTHVYAVAEKAAFEVRFPRVEGYAQAVRNRVAVDWDAIGELVVDPTRIPPEVQMKAGLPTNEGRMSVTGPGQEEKVSLERGRLRLQAVAFDLAQNLTRHYRGQRDDAPPSHVLFPQLLRIAQRYLETKVQAYPPGDARDVYFSPYFGLVIERLLEAVRPDEAAGEAAEVPIYEANRDAGSSADVDFFTRRPVREVVKSYLNYVVADTAKWEQSAAYFLDTHPKVRAFVKNDHLGFAIPYLDNDQMHEYFPDFVVRLDLPGERYLILETKGYDESAGVKRQAAERWVAAVNADGQYGIWHYAVAFKPTEVAGLVDGAVVTGQLEA